MAPIDLNLARMFVAVHETKSFSAAAQRLGVPRSTASRAIATLEDALRLRLFQRTTRAVSSTAAGDALYAKLQGSLDALESALRDLPEQDEAPSGTLRITSIADLAISVLAEAATRFTARYPKANVELHLSSELVDLVRDGFDLAMRVSSVPLKDSSLISRRVGAVVLALYASPTYLARRGTPRTPDELESHDLVTIRAVNRLTSPFPNALKLKTEPRIRCLDMFFAREVLRLGGGIGELPMFLAEPEVAAGNLVRVLPKSVTTTGTVYLVRPGAKRVPPKVTAFTAIVDELLRQRTDLSLDPVRRR